MTIIEALKTYIESCPYLANFEKEINVNYLESEDTSYSIETVPCNPILKKYLDGSCKKQYEFIFCSKESFGQDVLTNIEKSGFYESFSSWIEEQNYLGILPDLGEGKEAIKIKVNTNGYPFQTDIDQARYQIQLNLIYLER